MIDDETVGQKLLVGRAAERGAAGEHGRLEPAAVLVAAFEIQIGRPGQLFALFEHGKVGAAGIEPYVHGVGQFVVLFAVFGRQQLGFVEFEPGVDAFFFDAFGDFFQQRGGIGMQLAAFFMGKEGHRRAPVALAGNHPVGAAFDHRLQTGATPGGEKFGVVHRFDGFVAQGFAVGTGFVHADKPLAGGAVDQRGFMAPAVGVAVLDFGFAQQAVVFAQPVDNHGVGFPHAQAGHTRHFGDVAALGIDRIVEFDAIFVADEIVFQTVRGRGVYQTSTGIGGNVFAQ